MLIVVGGGEGHVCGSGVHGVFMWGYFSLFRGVTVHCVWESALDGIIVCCGTLPVCCGVCAGGSVSP